jgi:putative ABC transport system ATP-binding protein
MATLSPIEVTDASYFYGQGALRKQILFEASAHVDEGEIVILTGPSGSGKTTLLTLMGALRSAQEGSVKIFGEELKGAPEATLTAIRRRIGYIFQSHNLLKALNVEQNVQMAVQLGERSSRNDERNRIEEVLDRVGMIDHIAKRVDQLSGGQRQRVAIARALVNRPKVILADEPTASLDKESGRDVAQLIQQLAREEGASVVLVTHDNRILDIADRILHLEDGHMKELREALAGEASRALGVLAEHDPEAHRNLLLFSKALARVANSDRDIADEEVEVIRRVLSEEAALSTGEVDFVVSLAVAQVRSETAAEGPGGDTLADEQKQRLRAALRAVAEADGELSDSEREEISRIEAELSL